MAEYESNGYKAARGRDRLIHRIIPISGPGRPYQLSRNHFTARFSDRAG